MVQHPKNDTLIPSRNLQAAVKVKQLYIYIYTARPYNFYHLSEKKTIFFFNCERERERISIHKVFINVGYVAVN